MSKYTNKQLKEMALEAISARDSHDQRYGMLIMMLSVATGLQVSEIEQRIKEFAEYEES